MEVMYDYDTVISCAKKYSRSTADGRFGGAPKVKIKKKEYQDTMELTYLLATSNILRELIINYNHNNYSDLDEFVGDIQLVLKGVWDQCCNNKIGKSVFRPMTLDDIINNADVKDFVGPNARLDVKFSR